MMEKSDLYRSLDEIIASRNIKKGPGSVKSVSSQRSHGSVHSNRSGYSNRSQHSYRSTHSNRSHHSNRSTYSNRSQHSHQGPFRYGQITPYFQSEQRFQNHHRPYYRRRGLGRPNFDNQRFQHQINERRQKQLMMQSSIRNPGQNRLIRPSPYPHKVAKSYVNRAMRYQMVRHGVKNNMTQRIWPPNLYVRTNNEKYTGNTGIIRRVPTDNDVREDEYTRQHNGPTRLKIQIDNTTNGDVNMRSLTRTTGSEFSDYNSVHEVGSRPGSSVGIVSAYRGRNSFRGRFSMLKALNQKLQYEIRAIQDAAYPFISELNVDNSNIMVAITHTTEILLSERFSTYV